MTESINAGAGDKLKNCPFCGSAPISEPNHSKDETWVTITCSTDGCVLGNMAVTSDAWNDRSAPDAATPEQTQRALDHYKACRLSDYSVASDEPSALQAAMEAYGEDTASSEVVKNNFKAGWNARATYTTNRNAELEAELADFRSQVRRQWIPCNTREPEDSRYYLASYSTLDGMETVKAYFDVDRQLGSWFWHEGGEFAECIHAWQPWPPPFDPSAKAALEAKHPGLDAEELLHDVKNEPEGVPPLICTVCGEEITADTDIEAHLNHPPEV